MALLLFGAAIIRSSFSVMADTEGMARSYPGVPFLFGGGMMSEGKKSIRFVPEKFGVVWFIRAVYPGNQVVEHITGFASEAAAKEWIASDDAKVWLHSRGYLDD
jgi:hypothetical protein